MIWATISSRSCFCWMYRASSSLAAKYIISLILVLTIWWCPYVELSLVLLEENVLVIANTLFHQYKRRLYTWTSPDGQHRNQIDYILCRQRWRSSLQSAKRRPGAVCGSDHELLTAKFRFKLKKVGKTTRPFRYDLNQIPYDCTVEVRNRFKELDLIDRVPIELWTEVCNTAQEAEIKTIPKKKKCKRQNGCLRRPYK